MTKQEFTLLSKMNDVEIDNDTFYILHAHYMNSKSNKYDYCNNFVLIFKDWIFDNLTGLKKTNKTVLLKWFVRNCLGDAKI